MDGARSRTEGRRWILASAVILGVCTTVGTWHAVAPSVASRAGVMAAFVLVDTVLALVPLLRRARPLRAWAFVPIAAVCLSLALLTPSGRFLIGPVHMRDALFAGGYLCLSGWLLSLTHLAVGARVAWRALFDTVAASAGAVFATWALGTMWGTRDLPPSMTWAFYPIVDIIVIATATHLTFRLIGIVRAWWWVYCALFLELLLDIVYAVQGIGTGDRPDWPILAFGYLLVYAAITVGITHPAVLRLSSVPRRAVDLRSHRLPSLLIGISVLPVVAVVTLPGPRPPMEVASFALVATVLIVLSLRILHALAELAGSEADSLFQASHDQLTGLLNRKAFHDRLLARMTRDDAAGRHTALLLLDVDDFKYVNDTWGHQVGDQVLTSISATIRAVAGKDEDAARHGGDEFVVAASVDDPSEATALAERLRDRFDQAMPVLPQKLHRVTPSIGVAVHEPRTGETVDDLFRNADVALFAAKERGRDRWTLFDEQLRLRTVHRSELGLALQEAIRSGQIHPAFQPIHTGPRYETLLGFESLARWTHPTLGVIPPVEFIPLAEELDLIADLGDLMLRQTCTELARIRRALGRPDLVASVNVSAPQLLTVTFPDTVMHAVTASGLSPDALVLEITESLLIEDDSPALATIARLRGLGFTIALDDFGTGYASFTTLLRLPLDYVKVDRSIVQRVGRETEAVPQLRAVLDLITSLGIASIVAEGVETPEQAAALAYLGFPMAQGYLLGPPQPASLIGTHPGDGPGPTADEATGPLAPPIG